MKLLDWVKCVRAHTHTHTCTHTHNHKHMQTYIHTHTKTKSHSCLWISKFTHKIAHTCTHSFSHTHTHTHTYTHAILLVVLHWATSLLANWSLCITFPVPSAMVVKQRQTAHQAELSNQPHLHSALKHVDFLPHWMTGTWGKSGVHTDY